ncbi:MAG: PP2C family serine/threonine-protein phosphatase [Candidatus Hydrothermia bacterium]
MRLKKCPRCNTLNSLESKNCLMCGFDLNQYFCPVCGSKVIEGKEKCDICGASLRKYYFVLEHLDAEIHDPKYRIDSKEKFWTRVNEVNPNITKIQVDSPIFRFFSSFGNLYDALQLEKGRYAPVLHVTGEIKIIWDVWESLGEDGKIEFLKNFAEKIIPFKDLYFSERLEDFFVDERFSPLINISQEKKKGFLHAEEFLRKLISSLKGDKDSMWEKEKNEVIHKDFTIQRLLWWLNSLKASLNIPVIRYAGVSDKGPVRSSNEDAIMMIDAYQEIHRLDIVDSGKKYLFILSDGLGGHEKGEVAAEMITEGMRREFFKNLFAKKRVNVEDISESIEYVNNLVYSKNTVGEEASKKMGGTIAGLFIEGNRFIAFNVGDSPIFVFSEENYYEVSQRDVSTKKAKAITQAIGVKSSEELDVHIEELNVLYDKFKILICSDGLTDVVSESDIYSIVMDDKKSTNEKCIALLEEAYKKKTTDNVSVILVEVEKRNVIRSSK